MVMKNLKQFDEVGPMASRANLGAFQKLEVALLIIG